MMPALAIDGQYIRLFFTSIGISIFFRQLYIPPPPREKCIKSLILILVPPIYFKCPLAELFFHFIFH